MRQRDNHESYGVFASRLHWIAAIIALGLTGTVWLMYLLFMTWLGPPPRAPLWGAVPAPRLQTNPPVDLAAQRLQQRKLLSSYEWTSADRGIARIPVERAMELIVEQSAANPPDLSK
jgi:hypothetical protein